MRDKIEHGTHKAGESHPLARFSNDDVFEVLRLLSEGWTQWDVARKYGVTQSAISGIKLGKVWSELTGIKRSSAS